MKLLENGQEKEKEDIIQDFLDMVEDNIYFKDFFNEALNEYYKPIELFGITYHIGDIAERLNKTMYDIAFQEHKKNCITNVIDSLKPNETYEYNEDFKITAID